MSLDGSSVPVLDFSLIGLQQQANNIDKAALIEIGAKMKEALQKYGFFYAKNYGISRRSVDELMASAKEFFQGPLDLKNRHARINSGEVGWVSMGTERSNSGFQADLKESFNYHPADDRNEYLKSDFKVNNKEMFLNCSLLAMRVLDALSLALGFEQNILREAHKAIGKKGNQTFLRSLFYPSLPSDWKVTPRQIRLGEHTDFGTVTLNFQDDAGGLEMSTPSMGCIPITPIPETVAIFVGKQMQQLTADALFAGKHKILVPEDAEKAQKVRQSMVFLARADDDYIIKCLDGSDKYEPLSSVDYLNKRQKKVACKVNN